MVEAMADLSQYMKWLDTEQLLDLNAYTREAVGLSYRVAERSPQISPDVPVQYERWIIPAGVSVSMVNNDPSHDEGIFLYSRSFKLGRWLSNPRTADVSPPDRYVVVFGKGSRSCLGIEYTSAFEFGSLGYQLTMFQPRPIKATFGIGCRVPAICLRTLPNRDRRV